MKRYTLLMMAAWIAVAGASAQDTRPKATVEAEARAAAVRPARDDERRAQAADEAAKKARAEVQQEQSDKPQLTPDRVVVMYRLKYIDTQEAARIVSRVAGGSVTIATDGHNNGIVISGPHEAQDRLRELIAQIDQTPVDERDRTVSRYFTAPFKATPELMEMLRNAAGRDASVNCADRLVMVKGNMAACDAVAEVFEQLAAIDKRGRGGDVSATIVQLSAYFIEANIGPAKSGGASASSATIGIPLPATLSGVEKALAESGFSDFVLLSPLKVQVASGSEFNVNGTVAGTAAKVSVRGQVEVGRGGGDVQLRIEAGMEQFVETPATKGPMGAIRVPTNAFNLQTTVTTRVGEYVVLAAGPNSENGRTTALVIRLTAQ